MMVLVSVVLALYNAVELSSIENIECCCSGRAAVFIMAMVAVTQHESHGLTHTGGKMIEYPI